MTFLEIAALIITISSLLGAIGSIFAILYKTMKWIDNQKQQDEKIKELEDKHKKDLEELKAKHDEDMGGVRNELRVICTGVLACLDGLEQKGCNHTVPKAKELLEEHLNKIAHQ